MLVKVKDLIMPIKLRVIVPRIDFADIIRRYPQDLPFKFRPELYKPIVVRGNHVVDGCVRVHMAMYDSITELEAIPAK